MRSPRSPAWLPGDRFLFTRGNEVFAQSTSEGTPVKILTDGIDPTYVPPSRPGSSGRLLFVRGDSLVAQPFNADKLELEGEAVSIASPVGDLTGRYASAFTASANGVLVFGTGNSPDVGLTWLDRKGKRLQGPGRLFRQALNPAIRLSPNESQAIVPIAGTDGAIDLWIADLNRNTFSRFTFNGSLSGVWSPDGRKVLWAATDGNRYLKSADGSGKDELVFKNPNLNGYLMDWSSDGKFVVASGQAEKPNTIANWLVPMDADRKPFRHVESPFSTYWAQFSPDSRWIAYGSDQTPQPQQVFIESLQAGKGRWQVSTETGDWAIWRRDGKELFYRKGTKIIAVPIRLTETAVEIGKAQTLFDIGPLIRYQVSRDGQRFLVALPSEGANASTSLTVDTDWRAALEK
jgi:hypothetical protein